MARPRLQEDEKLVPVPTRLSPETLKLVEQVAGTREWPIGKTIRAMVEAAIQANLVPAVTAPQASQADINLQSAN